MTLKEELNHAVEVYRAKEPEREKWAVERLEEELRLHARMGRKQVEVDSSVSEFERVSPWWRFWRAEFRPTGDVLATCNRLERLGVPYRCDYKGWPMLIARVYAILSDDQ